MALYLANVLVWSFTWLAIQYQLGVVPEAWSIFYRFFSAGVLLAIFCIVTRRNLRYSWSEHGLMAIQGILLFSINFLFFYMASAYLISGVIAVTFATLVVMNIINGRIFFKTQLSKKVLLGSVIGMTGLVFVFWVEMKPLMEQPESLHELLLGFGLCIIATLFASFGNMVAKYLQTRRQVPVLQSNGYSMIYGALFTAILALIMQQPMTFDTSPDYLIALLYLSVFGSVIGYGCYLKLVGNIGPERAAYVFIVIPVLALLISTFVENFQWEIGTLAGVVLIGVGNYLVLSNKRVA